MTETTSPITANFDKTVDSKDFKFNFKKDKLGNKRATVEIKGLVPSVEGLIAIIEKGGKGLELLQDAMYDVIRSQIAGDVADDEKFNQTSYDSAVIKIGEVEYPKYSWDAIANQPKEDRRASSIPEELWSAFAANYVAVMPSVANKTADQVGNAVQIYLKKFSLVKTNKPVITALKAQLALFAEHSPEAENFTDILELLLRKADLYLEASDVEKLIGNL